MRDYQKIFGSTLMCAVLAIVFAVKADSREYGEESAGGARQYEESIVPALEHSLESYLEYAASQNPALRAAFYEWKATLRHVSVVKALPDPQLSFSHFLESVETRVGPQDYKLSLRQAIPWFGTLGARGDIASRDAEAAFYRLEAVKQELLYRVKTAYIDYYLLGKQISIAAENMELLKSLEVTLTAR
ncbi:MAG: TolC family protein, partial [candidate division Zixibacteria bacterium]